MNTLADRLKSAREALGMSQEQLAQSAGVSQGTIGNIESGARKRPREIVALARAAKVRPEWLLNGAGPRSASEANSGQDLHEHDFFYRFDGLSLVAGNKSSGFDFLVKTETLRQLLNATAIKDLQARTVTEARARIERAGLLPKRSLERAGIIFWKETMVPRIFHCDAVFGGSLSADPATFERLAMEDATLQLSHEVCYSPHNVDTPKSAMALMVMAQTWSEHVLAQLQLTAVLHSST